MSQFNFAQLLNSDFAKNFAVPAGFPFDVKSLIETQRKNIQALTEAQQVAFENLQAVAQRQTEILSQFVQDHTTIAQDIIAEGTPEKKVAKQADMIKKAYEKSIKNWSEISDMIGQSNAEASDIINKRVTASLTEIKAALEKKSPAPAATATAKKAA